MRNGLARMLMPAAMAAIVVAATAVFTAGCGRKAEDSGKELSADVLLSVGDSVLTMRDVLLRIPPGMEPEDSVALFQNLVDGWLERMLLEDVARENIDDIEEIDRMVEDYRKKLMIATYRRKLREQGETDVDEKEVRKYYDAHQEAFVLERPVVKGLYVKLPSDAGRLGDVRRWMTTATPDAIDNIESYGLGDAAEYSFFEDRWTDWAVPASRIPYRIENPDEFVAGTVNFETEYGGMTYLLHISEYMPSGERMPYEVAATGIRERLETLRGEDYEEKLIRGLYRKARASGRLKYVNYDPEKQKMIL